VCPQTFYNSTLTSGKNLFKEETRMKNNTFKRIAAGALATISVATNVMSANVGGNVFVDSIRATLIANAAEEEQNLINFNNVVSYIDSITVDKVTYSHDHLLLLQKDGLKSVAGKKITVKAYTALSITKDGKITTVDYSTEAFHTTKVDPVTKQDVVDKRYIAADADKAYTSVIKPKLADKLFYNPTTNELTAELPGDTDLSAYKLVPSNAEVFKNVDGTTPLLLVPVTENGQYGITYKYNNATEFVEGEDYYELVNADNGTYKIVRNVTADNFATKLANANGGKLYTIENVYTQDVDTKTHAISPTANITTQDYTVTDTLKDGYYFLDGTINPDKVGKLSEDRSQVRTNVIVAPVAYTEFKGIENNEDYHKRVNKEEDSYTKTIEEDGTYTYTFNMPEFEINFDTIMFNIADQNLATVAPAKTTNNAGDLGYRAGTNMTVTSNTKQLLDVVTYKYATDANGNNIQLTDANGNLIYKKAIFSDDKVSAAIQAAGLDDTSIVTNAVTANDADIKTSYTTAVGAVMGSRDALRGNDSVEATNKLAVAKAALKTAKDKAANLQSAINDAQLAYNAAAADAAITAAALNEANTAKDNATAALNAANTTKETAQANLGREAGNVNPYNFGGALGYYGNDASIITAFDSVKDALMAYDANAFNQVTADNAAAYCNAISALSSGIDNAIGVLNINEYRDDDLTAVQELVALKGSVDAVLANLDDLKDAIDALADATEAVTTAQNTFDAAADAVTAAETADAPKQAAKEAAQTALGAAQAAYTENDKAAIARIEALIDTLETLINDVKDNFAAYSKPVFFVAKDSNINEDQKDLYTLTEVNAVFDDNGRLIVNFTEIGNSIYNVGLNYENDPTDKPISSQILRTEYTPVSAIEEVKIKTTRTDITNKGEITQYKYSFKMPDIEDCVIDDEIYTNIKNYVYVQNHHHVDEWEYSTSVDGTELYRQCKSDDGDACPENGEKLLVAMIRNKVVGEDGKVTYDKIDKYTYGDCIDPVLLTLVFDEDGVPTVENGKLKYMEKQLGLADVKVVKSYEDTDDSLADDDPEEDDYVVAGFDIDNTDIGNYVVKCVPRVTTKGQDQNASLYAPNTDDVDMYDLYLYFAVAPQPLSVDSISPADGSAQFDKNKQVFNVTPVNNFEAKFENFNFVIKNKDNEELVEGTDYIIIGKTSADKAGSYTFTVKGIGNYTGTFQVKWNLSETAAEKELTADMVRIESFSHGSYAERVITIAGLDEYGRITEDAELEENVNYEVSGTRYATEKGTYDITIKGKGIYYGTLNLKWNVTRADITGGTAVVNGATFNASEKKLSISTVSALREYNGVDIKDQTLIRAGLVATKDFTLAEGMDVNTNNSAVYVRGLDGADVENKVSYVFTWNKTNSTANDIWYVKPFTTFKIGTKTITVYGDLTRVQGNTSEVIVNGSAQIRTTKCSVKADETNAGKKVLATNAYLAVPDGCTMKKAGIIASTSSEKTANKTVSASEAQSTANDLFVRFKEGNDVAPYSRYSFTWKKTNLANDAVYYVKPFVQYTDPDGVLHTVYGDVTKMSVADYFNN
jgi:hypothetical protein